MMAAGVRWCVLVTVTLNWLTIAPLNAGPVSINPAISPFGRNIRPITCKSKTGQMGTCMFAMDCTRMNGQHLGTCIDRFYFGSCCAPSDSVMDFPPTTTEGFNGANDLGFSSSLPPLAAPVSPLLTMTTSQHPNILADLTTTTTTTTASSAVPTLGVTETSAAPPTTTTVSSTTVGVVTNPTLAEILASTPLSTLLANPSIHPSSTTEATQTTLKATSQQPSIGTDLPSSFSPVEEVVNVTTTTTPVTTTTTITTTTTTTTAAAIILDMTQSTSTTLSPTTTPDIGTTTIASTTTLPSTTVSSAPPQAETTAATTPGLTNPAELTAVGSSSASPVALSPEESTATDSSLGDEQDEITTLEPVTDLPSAPLEPVAVPVAETEIPPPPSTEQTVEVTTSVEDSVEDGVTDIRPESTDANEEEIVTGSSVAVQTETQAPITTTTTTPIPTTVVVTEVITKAPATSPASPSTTTAVPDTTIVVVSTSSSTSIAPETTITTSTTASPSSTILPETTAPEVSITSSSSPVTTTTTLVSSTTTISEELSTSQPETFVATTDVPHWITGDPIDSSGNESTTTPTIVSTTFAELNDTVEGPTVQFQNYREVCGRPKYQYPSARIVGGTTTHYGQWPWQVSLRQWRTATFLHKCGAALLNENWAITAAHCVDNVQPDDLLLRMGEYDLATDEEEFPYIERKVQIVASHPQFDSRTFEYDLALLRFYDPVRFQPNIVPICLPPPSEVDFVGRTAFVTGWGRLYEDGPLPSKMQQVSVPVINNSDCENMYRRAGYVEHIPNIFICAGYADGKKDSCEGDSGGPMVIQEENSWVLAGVISWGIGCAEANQPGVYTRISEFREWIDKIIVF